MGHHRAQQKIDRQSALQTAEKENTDRIPFTLTFHPHNHAVKSIIIKHFKLLQNDWHYLSQPPLISFKRDKNIGNFLVRSSFQTNDQPETLKCARSRCKTCPFIHNVEKISDPRDPLRSLITVRVPPPMSFTSQFALIAISYTLVKQEDD